MTANATAMAAWARGVRMRWTHARITTARLGGSTAEAWTAAGDRLVLGRARITWWAGLLADRVIAPQASAGSAAKSMPSPRSWETAEPDSNSARLAARK